MTPYIANGMYDDLARDMHHSQRRKRYLHPERWYIAGAAHPLTPGPRQVHASRDVTDPRDSETPPSLLRQTVAGQTPKAASAS